MARDGTENTESSFWERIFGGSYDDPGGAPRVNPRWSFSEEGTDYYNKHFFWQEKTEKRPVRPRPEIEMFETTTRLRATEEHLKRSKAGPREKALRVEFIENSSSRRRDDFAQGGGGRRGTGRRGERRGLAETRPFTRSSGAFPRGGRSRPDARGTVAARGAPRPPSVPIDVPRRRRARHARGTQLARARAHSDQAAPGPPPSLRGGALKEARRIRAPSGRTTSSGPLARK